MEGLAERESLLTCGSSVESRLQCQPCLHDATGGQGVGDLAGAG